MTSPKSYVTKKAARKAAQVTLRHARHGTVTKAKRQPIRSVTLLTVGAALGALVTLLVVRLRASEGTDEVEPVVPVRSVSSPRASAAA